MKAKRILSLILTAVFIISLIPTAVFAGQNYFSDVVFDKITIIENTRGWQTRSVVSSGDEEPVTYDWYDYNIEPEYVHVYYEDGTSETMTYYAFTEMLPDGEYYLSSDQSCDSPWGIGTHTASFCFDGEEYVYEIEIVESPVESLSATKEPIMEGTCRYSHSYSNEETGEYYEFMEYEFRPDSLTIFYKDGTFVTIDTYGGDMSRVEEQTGYFAETFSDQGPDNEWGVGIHNAYVTYLGCTLCYEVEITPSPVKSIAVDTIKIVEGTGGHTEWGYDPETDDYEVFYVYDVEPEDVTINYTDGEVLRCPYYDLFNMTGESGSYSHGQTYENRWGVGHHTATFYYMGRECEYDVEIVPSPIESISAEPTTIIEGTCGYMDSDFDPETGDQTPEYFKYDCYIYSNKIRPTVKFKDGHTETLNPIYLDYEGKRYHREIYDDQSYGNQWGVGEHKATLSLLGAECEVIVNVIPSPIESISAEPTTIIEGTYGGMDCDFDPETGEWTPEYFKYNVGFHYPLTTVKFKDGHTEVGRGSVSYDGEWYSGDMSDDQSYDNQWGVGEHKATISLLGVECEVTVNVVPSPVESISAEPVTLMEGIDGYTASDYDPETYTDGPEYFKYNYYSELTVKLTDGTVSTADGLFEYGGYDYWPEYSDDQSYDNQWGVGHHTGTVNLLGKECTVDVEVIENPVDHVVFDELEVQYLVDGNYYSTGEQDGSSFFQYEYFPEFTAYMKDGSVVRSDRGNIEIAGRNFTVEYRDDQYKEWGLGEHTVHMSVAGFEDDVKVTVVPAKIDGVEISGRDELTVTLHYKDGSTKDCRAWGFEIKAGDVDRVIGVLNTDKGDFAATIIGSVSENRIGMMDRGVKVVLGTLESNTLDVCYWPRLMDCQGTYTLFSNMLRSSEGFDGYAPDNYSVDDVIRFAVDAVVKGEGSFGYDEHGYYFNYTEAQIREAVRYVFGIDDLDLTEYTYYDPAKPNEIRVYILWLSGFWGDTDIDKEQSGGWTITFRPEDDLGYECLTIRLRPDCTVESITFGDAPAEQNIASVAISGDETLHIEVTFDDGTAASADALGFDTPNPAAYPLEGTLHTDAGDVEVSIEFDRTEDDTHRFVDRNVSVTVDGVKSNTLASNAWLKSRLMGNSIPFVASIFKSVDSSFDGIDASKASVNDLVAFAAYSTGEFENYEAEEKNGKLYICVPADTAKDIVSYVFGIDDVDLSGYKQIGSTGLDVLDVELYGFDFGALPQGDAEITYENGEWRVDYTVTGGDVDYEAIAVTADGHFNLKTIGFTAKEQFMLGDVNGDGDVTMRDVLKIRRYIAGLDDLTPEEFERADVNGDGDITMRDVLKIRRYIAGIDTEM